MLLLTIAFKRLLQYLQWFSELQFFSDKLNSTEYNCNKTQFNEMRAQINITKIQAKYFHFFEKKFSSLFRKVMFNKKKCLSSSFCFRKMRANFTKNFLINQQVCANETFYFKLIFRFVQQFL